MNQNQFFADSMMGLPEDIALLKAHGDFDNALRLIDLRLSEPLPECMRRNFEVQKEIIRRLPANYPFTVQQALDRVREEIPDFTMEELQHYMDIGRVTWLYVNGEIHIIRSFFGTLCKRAEIKARLPKKEPAPGTSHELRDSTAELDRFARTMREKGGMTADIRLRASIRVRDDYFVPGETYRVHLPLPAKCIQQQDIEILSCTPEPTHIAREDADQRTVYWEETMQENHEFAVEYRYRHHAPFVDPSKIKALPVQPSFYTGEIAPHIMFTPFIRALCAELTEGVTDPIEKARRFYDYVTTKVDYSFMPAYFILPDIAENCLRTRRGDCGVQALAFITLCRCAGIPAKWQSGLEVEPDEAGCHDWAMFYVAPYGWMFADPSFGGSAYRAGSELRHNHYFGNLDIYRCVTTNNFYSEFEPASTYWRDDPYDNQVGEVEDSRHGYRSKEVETHTKVISFREIDE